MPVLQVFCDGGLLGLNGPGGCPDGGTWAWVHVGPEGVIASASGVVLPGSRPPFDKVTNNVTELIAMLRALRALPDGWSGEVLSDSLCTIKRLKGHDPEDLRQWENLLETVPEVLALEITRQTKRLGKLTYILLEGHPSKAHLKAGTKNGNPVSIYNKWCDTACKKEKKAFWDRKRK